MQHILLIHLTSHTCAYTQARLGVGLLICVFVYIGVCLVALLSCWSTGEQTKDLKRMQSVVSLFSAGAMDMLITLLQVGGAGWLAA